MAPIEIIRAREEQIKFNRFESAFAVDGMGRVLLDKAGEQFQADSGPEEVQILKAAQGVIFTHNHPRGWDYPPEDARHAGTSFSDADVAFACETAVAEVRVVTPMSCFFMLPSEAGWDRRSWRDTLHPLCVRHGIAVRHDLSQAIGRRQMTPQDASVRHWHEIWTRVARDAGLVYGQEQE